MGYKTLYKRASFTLQKGVFYTSKGHLLLCNRCPFTMQKSICCFSNMKLYYKQGGACWLGSGRVMWC